MAFVEEIKQSIASHLFDDGIINDQFKRDNRSKLNFNY